MASSDGYLEGGASSTVSLAWPTGAATRPPELSFRLPVSEMPEDGSILLGPVNVRFGDGGSVVQGTLHCSAGLFELGHQVDNDGSPSVEGVVVVDGEGEGDGNGEWDTVVLQGLPKDVAAAMSMVTYRPPKDWSSRVHGVVILTMDIQAAESLEVKDHVVAAVTVAVFSDLGRKNRGIVGMACSSLFGVKVLGRVPRRTKRFFFVGRARRDHGKSKFLLNQVVVRTTPKQGVNRTGDHRQIRIWPGVIKRLQSRYFVQARQRFC